MIYIYIYTYIFISLKGKFKNIRYIKIYNYSFEKVNFLCAALKLIFRMVNYNEITSKLKIIINAIIKIFFLFLDNI